LASPAVLSVAVINFPYRYSLLDSDLREMFERWGSVLQVQINCDGALEVGVVHFADRAAAGYAQQQLNEKEGRLHGGHTGRLAVVFGGPEQLSPPQARQIPVELQASRPQQHPTMPPAGEMPSGLPTSIGSLPMGATSVGPSSLPRPGLGAPKAVTGAPPHPMATLPTGPPGPQGAMPKSAPSPFTMGNARANSMAPGGFAAPRPEASLMPTSALGKGDSLLSPTHTHVDGKGGMGQAPRMNGLDGFRPAWRCKVIIHAELLHKEFPTVQKILGLNGQNMDHVRTQTRCRLQLRGRGSGLAEPETGQEAPEPMFLWLSSDTPEAGKSALDMCQDLLLSVYEEHQGWCQQHNLVHPGMLEPVVVENDSVPTVPAAPLSAAAVGGSTVAAAAGPAPLPQPVAAAAVAAAATPTAPGGFGPMQAAAGFMPRQGPYG